VRANGLRGAERRVAEPQENGALDTNTGDGANIEAQAPVTRGILWKGKLFLGNINPGSFVVKVVFVDLCHN